jgi:hypothetical protein
VDGSAERSETREESAVSDEKRKVVVAHTYLLEHEVPADWTDEEVEFFYDGSLHCASNEIKTLAGMTVDGNCCCHIHSAKVHRETP